MLNKKGKTMNSKYLYYMLILKSSKTIIAELTIKQEKQIVDCLKENAPERVYDGQFTDISGKVWNYSDVEKIYYISPNEYVHLDAKYSFFLQKIKRKNIL